MKRRKQMLLVAYEERNRPYDVHRGQFVDTRVWLNLATHTWSELRADFHILADDARSPSFSEGEIQDIYKGCRLALRLMRKHRTRQLWRRFLFR
jgi:hypothetical protein